MKALIHCLWIAVLFIGCLPVNAHEKLSLCSADSPPWTIKTGYSPYAVAGLAVEIMSELSRRADISIEMQALPFKRCLEYTRYGVNDGCFMTIKNAERESYAHFTDSYLSIPTYVYYETARLGIFEWNSWDDLKNYRIGSQRGFRYGQEFTHAKQSVPLRLSEINSVKIGLDMLLKGRVDLVLSNEYRFEYLMKIHPELKGRFSRAQKPVAIGHVYIAISKKSPNAAIVQKLNKALGEMKSDGTIQKIVQQ